MSRKRKGISVSSIIPYIVIFCMAFAVFAKVSITPGDDEWFYNALNLVGDGTYIGYLKFRFFNWTGRIVVESIMVPMLQMNPWIWRVLNSLIILVMTYGIYNLIPVRQIEKLKENQKNIIKILIGIGAFAFNIYVFFAGIRWMTGSFNYIWPMSLGIIAILPFKRILFEEEFDKKLFVIYFIITILASNSEQVSLVILCFGIITNIVIYLLQKKVNVVLIAYNIFMVINTVVLFVAPGNYVRTKIEAANNYPGWEHVSIFEKLLRGINLLTNHLVNNAAIFMLIIAVTLFILIKNNCKKTLVKVMATVTLIVFSIVPLISVSEYLLNKIFKVNIDLTIRIRNALEYSDINSIKFSELTKFVPTFIALAFIMIIAVLMILAVKCIKEKYMITILYLASLAASVSICMSPTMYVSGQRVFLVTDVLLLIISTLLSVKLVEDKLYKNIVYIITIILFIAIAIIRWMYWAFIY